MKQRRNLFRRLAKQAMPESPLKIKVETGCIGPSHDPYGTETVFVEQRAGYGNRAAEWYSNGLGTCIVRLFDGDDETRVLKWINPCAPYADWPMEARNQECLAEILFRRWVGISRHDACVQADRSYGRDPIQAWA